MTKLLVLESSLFPATISASRRVTGQLVDALIAAEPKTTIIRRDLAVEPLAHVGMDLMGGAMTPPADHTPAQAQAVSLSETLIDELMAADVVVIGAPMYNFSVPSTLKAWIDNVARAGKTFRYTAQGPEGLVTGKRVFIVASRGGGYSEGPMTAFNFQDPYLRTVLGLLGMTDVTVITAEALRVSPEAEAVGYANATRQIAEAVGSAERLVA
jgi:FMN-dependent NADH-azoreductase